MALTSRDETDLLLALLGGMEEDRPFSTFLERVRRRANAVHASLTIRPRDAIDITHLFVGADLRRLSQEVPSESSDHATRIQYDRLRPGRVYGADEFDAHDPVAKARRARAMRNFGVADERVVRVLADDRANAWLGLASAQLCTASDSALLSNLAPYVALALGNFVRQEEDRLNAAMSARSLARAGTGWIVFDKGAHILSISPESSDMVEAVTGRRPRAGDRLREFGPAAERVLVEAAASFGHDPHAPDRALVLHESPRVETLVCAASEPSALLEPPVMVAYCRHARPVSTQRIEHVAQLFELPRREAELAALLAEGYSLVQAGSAMGLTIETVRNYSKRIFLKLGVRGQADLVRAIHQSCAMLG